MTSTKPEKPEANIRKNSLIFILLRIVLGFTIIILLTSILSKKCIFISSEEAVINSRLVTLRTPISGYLSLRSGIEAGFILKKDSFVFQINNPRFGNTESGAQYNYLQNLIDVVADDIKRDDVYRKRHETDYERFKKLEKVGGVAKRDLEEIKNNLDVLNSSVENKRQQLEHLKQRFIEAQQQLELQKETSILMPFDGVIWSVLINNGEYINQNDDIIQIVNPDDIWVDAFFSEKYAKKLKPQTEVIISEIGSDRKWSGKILFTRAGVGRISYNSSVAVPPRVLERRLIAVRVKVDWDKTFEAEEFYGIGRSVDIKLKRN